MSLIQPKTTKQKQKDSSPTTTLPAKVDWRAQISALIRLEPGNHTPAMICSWRLRREHGLSPLQSSNEDPSYGVNGVHTGSLNFHSHQAVTRWPLPFYWSELREVRVDRIFTTIQQWWGHHPLFSESNRGNSKEVHSHPPSQGGIRGDLIGDRIPTSTQ